MSARAWNPLAAKHLFLSTAQVTAFILLTGFLFIQLSALGARWPVLPGPIGNAVFYVAIVWLLAWIVMLRFYDESLLAARASVSAAWFVPGFLLLSTGDTLGMSLGLLIFVNTTRLLCGRVVLPHATHTFIGWTEPSAVLAGALAVQCSPIVMLAGYPLEAAGLAAAGTAVLVKAAVEKGALQSGVGGARSSALRFRGIMVPLMLTTVLSVGQLARDGDVMDTPSLLRAAGRIFGESPRARTSLTRLVKVSKPVADSGARGAPVVILHPEITRQPAIRRVVASVPSHAAIFRDLTIPFTGDYHLFLMEAGYVPRNAVEHAGTPLTQHYQASGGERWRRRRIRSIDPPIDFSDCGKVLLTIQSGEKTQSSATMQLMAGSVMEGAWDAVVRV